MGRAVQAGVDIAVSGMCVAALYARHRSIIIR